MWSRLHRGDLGPARSAEDSVLHRPERGSGSSRYPALGVDVLNVMVGGLRRDEEPIGDLSRRESLRRQAQHLDLTTGKPAGVVAPAGR